jgi:hypothetical protein
VSRTNVDEPSAAVVAFVSLASPSSGTIEFTPSPRVATHVPLQQLYCIWRN